MLHHMKLQPEPFHKIKNGTKTIELRLNDAKRQKINVGDQIEFLNLQNKIQKLRVRVLALHKFASFEELYKHLPLTKCGYQDDKYADPADMETYYTKHEQSQYGVLGIEIELMDWKDEQLTKTSRYISLLLRHRPDIAGITLDECGWAKVTELIQGVNRTQPLTMEVLEQIVETDEKQRYSFNENKTLIRANQGHSIPVDVQLERKQPPAKLWYGTGEKYVESINQKGLLSKTRLYVHLSADYDTAISVGRRHGKPVVYEVDTEAMHRDGYEFYLSVNNVWLTKYVPTTYLSNVE